MECKFYSFFRDIVELLLSYEASCNSADDKGSSPLHLAAWAGNKDIVDVLLTKGPSIANVNLTVSLTMHMLCHVLSKLFCCRNCIRCLRTFMCRKQSIYNLVNIVMYSKILDIAGIVCLLAVREEIYRVLIFTAL